MSEGGRQERRQELGVHGALTRLLGRAGGQEAAAISAATLRSDRFRIDREADWRRLEAIVGRLEAGRLRALSDEDLTALPVLYREAVSSLSIARETSLDAAALAYLEALVRRAWFQVYGPRVTLGGWLRRFFGGEWSRAVRAIGFDVGIALLLMVLGTVAGWLLVAGDPAWYAAFVPAEPGEVRVPGASQAALRGVLFGHSGESGLAAFAAMLFGHNAQISLLAFALGFAFGVPSLMLLVQNAGMLGAMLWLYHGRGLTLDLVGWLSIHGTTELFAVLLSGAAGLHIGRAMAFPGRRGVLAAAGAAGRRASVVMIGVIVMLVVAACLEGLGRQLVDETSGRLVVGGAMLAFWLWYFYAFGRGRAA
ncbi:MAG: stage II sporulation protein M [Sphingomonadales bacterium]|nr:stage II sporulation protein M [Sphingomonadales bacterium]